MAGYGSQQDYEADLLQTYLRKGRVSPIAKRDVDLALSIYRMPKSKTDYKDQKTLTHDTAKAAAKGKTDLALLKMATTTVLNKAFYDKKAAAAAAKAGTKPGTSAPAPTGTPPRPASNVPSYTAPTQNSYTGPLTPPTVKPKPVAPPAPKATYKPRTPRIGGGYRPR